MADHEPTRRERRRRSEEERAPRGTVQQWAVSTATAPLCLYLLDSTAQVLMLSLVVRSLLVVARCSFPLLSSLVLVFFDIWFLQHLEADTAIDR